MWLSFPPKEKLILIAVRLDGPNGARTCTFGLDTGATVTAVSDVLLRSLGFPVDSLPVSGFAQGVNGNVPVRRVVLPGLSALGESRHNFPILSVPLNQNTSVVGLLGLDFLRGRVLTLDMYRGRLRLRSARRWWPF